jgi:hypothetical protein
VVNKRLTTDRDVQVWCAFYLSRQPSPVLCILQVGDVLAKQAARKAVVQAFLDPLDSLTFTLKVYVSLHYSLRQMAIFGPSDEAAYVVNFVLTSRF